MSAPSLWTKHRGYALTLAQDWYLPGQDRDDVRQEALIGLWIAARTYDPTKGASFKTYAYTVIRRHLKDCLRKANGQKQRFLTDAERDLDIQAVEREDGQLQLIIDLLPRLSDLERAALADSLNGKPIASKRADNALQRARRKLAVA